MKQDKEKVLKALGNRVKKLRLSKKMTQFELASFIYKDQQSIQRLEAGRVNPSYLYLLEVCEGLSIGIDELIDGL